MGKGSLQNYCVFFVRIWPTLWNLIVGAKMGMCVFLVWFAIMVLFWNVKGMYISSIANFEVWPQMGNFYYLILRLLLLLFFFFVVVIRDLFRNEYLCRWPALWILNSEQKWVCICLVLLLGQPCVGRTWWTKLPWGWETLSPRGPHWCWWCHLSMCYT